MGEKLITRKCKECHEEFSITEEHAHWFKEKGLAIPKRCPNCLQRRKDMVTNANPALLHPEENDGILHCSGRYPWTSNQNK